MHSELSSRAGLHRLVIAVLLAALAGVGALVSAGPGGGAGEVSATGHESGSVGLVAVGPERVLDTRETRVIDTREVRSMVAPGEVTRVELSGMPRSAAAVVANVTVTNAVGDGFVTVWGCDDAQPQTSNANFVGIDTVAASVIVGLGDSGAICVTTGQSAAHVVVDVFGYFTADSGIVTTAPVRVLDTRGASGPVAAGTSVTAELSGLPDDAVAAIVNVTAANATGDGFFTVWNCTGDAPGTSNGNYVGVNTMANLAIVPIVSDEVCVQPGDAAAHILVDVFGYLTSTSGLIANGPTRTLDTRTTGDTLSPGHIRTVTLPGMPAGSAAILNVTATNAQGPGYFTVWNCDQDQPVTSNGNYVGVTTIANLVITTTSTAGTICVTTSQHAADLIIDTLAHLPPAAPEPDPTTTTTTAPPPCRDTLYATTVGGLGISSDGGATFTNRTTADGLGSNLVFGVFVSGSTVYAATEGGLSISSDGGATFTNRTTADGLGNNSVSGVFVSGSTVYAATDGGLSFSTDGGVTFINRTTSDGLGSNRVRGVFVSGSTVYAATNGGLSISTDGGVTFMNRTSADGLGSNVVRGVFVSGSTVYAATNSGLGISTDGGATFTNRTTADGLGSSSVFEVFVSGSTVYAATNSGLGISTDGGATFTNRTTADGLGADGVRGVLVSGSTVYAANNRGLGISTDGGATFTNRTTADGLGDNLVGEMAIDLCDT